MKKTFISAFLVAFTMAGIVQAQQLAFPGAEGFGRFAQGARAGDTQEIYHVTSLNDSGTGSLRDAISKPNRIIVFDVSGVIKITSRLVFSKNLTIAGQTAPGEGVTIYGNGVSFSAADNVIVRYIRFRMGTGGDSGKDAAGIANGSNMIFDHVSVAWGLDENFSISWDNKGTEPGNITIQNSIIGQGIQTHSCGGLIQTNGGVTLFRNLYIDNKTRNPKVKGLNQYVNNVVYNWGSGGCYILGDTEGHSWGAIEDNYFIKGPVDGTNVFTRATPTFQVYQKGNMIDYSLDGVLNGRDATEEDYRRSEDINVTFVSSYDGFSNAPQRHPEIESATSALDAYNWIVQNAGASLPARDAVDKYMVDELTSLGTKGALINGEADLGLPNKVGYIFEGNKLLDTDGDGMPDVWEDANGLDKNNAADALQTAQNGYLNIENYINSITAPIPYVKYPTNFQVTGLSKTNIALKWENNADKATAISLEKSTDNKNFTPVIIGADVSSYDFEELTPGTTYYFRIKTVNGELESFYTKVLTAATNGEPGPPIASINPVPGDEETVSDYSNATLSWENYTGIWGGVLSYSVYMGESSESLDVVAADLKTMTCKVAVKPNTAYYWRVDVKNALGSKTGDIWMFTSGVKPQRDKVAYYTFDQAEGSSLENEIGPNAVAKDFSPVWVEGKIENAVNFSGETGSAFVQEHYDDIALGSESFSVEFWFKSAGGSVDWYLIHKGSHAKTSYDGATGRWFGVQYQKNTKNDRLTWAIDDDVTKSDINATSGSQYFNNEWVHVICIRDVEEKKLRLYINGKLAVSGDDKTGDIGTIEKMAIGNCNSAYENAFKGLMDDLSIYQGVLTAEEVEDHYQQGTITRIEKETKNKSNLTVFPVPFTDRFTVSMSATEDILAYVTISDMTGQCVWTDAVNVMSGNVTIDDLGSLASGYYICTVKYGDQTAVVKVVK